IGYDPVEYDPALWNRGRVRKLVHIESVPVDLSGDYRPTVELLGGIAATLKVLTAQITARPHPAQAQLVADIRRQHDGLAAEAARHTGMPVHPLQLMHALQGLLDEDTTLCSDIGSFHIWIARHLVAHRPRQIMISNGQQTL